GRVPAAQDSRGALNRAAPRLPSGGIDRGDALVLAHRIADRHMDGRDDAADRRLDRDLHLHAFDEQQGVALGDLVAGGDEKLEYAAGDFGMDIATHGVSVKGVEMVAKKR